MSKTLNAVEDCRRIGDCVTNGVDAIERHVVSAQGSPLFVIVGESHSNASHLIAQIAMMQGMKDRGYTIACGIEWPYNTAAASFLESAKTLSSEKKDAIANALLDFKGDDPLHLKTVVGFSSPAASYLTFLCLHRFLLESGISARFNDAARTHHNQSYNLDQNDPVFRAMIETTGADVKMFHNDGERINAALGSGVFARNKIMHDFMRAHAALTRPDIYFHLGGDMHLAGGNDEGGMLYEASLMGMARGDSVLGLSLSGLSVPDVALASGALIENLKLDGPEFALHEQAAEQTWLNTVLSYVLPGTTLNHDLETFKLSARGDAVNDFRAMVRALNTASGPRGPTL